MDICTIYVIKNYLNNKVYVGQTWGSLSDRFNKHKLKNSGCKKLLNAFQKYDYNNFYIEPIAFVLSQEDADKVEDIIIRYFDSINNGYNIREGGSKGKQSEETKAKISASNKLVQKGLKKSPRTLEHISNWKSSRRRKSKINEQIVKQIRAEYAAGLVSTKQLSIKYSIGNTTVKDILNYRIWKDII